MLGVERIDYYSKNCSFNQRYGKFGTFSLTNLVMKKYQVVKVSPGGSFWE